MTGRVYRCVCAHAHSMNKGYNRDDSTPGRIVCHLRRASETALAEDLGPELFELGGVYDPGVAQLGELLETGDRSSSDRPATTRTSPPGP